MPLPRAIATEPLSLEDSPITTVERPPALVSRPKASNALGSRPRAFSLVPCSATTVVSCLSAA